jgi:hypothetical protein
LRTFDWKRKRRRVKGGEDHECVRKRSIKDAALADRWLSLSPVPSCRLHQGEAFLPQQHARSRRRIEGSCRIRHRVASPRSSTASMAMMRLPPTTTTFLANTRAMAVVGLEKADPCCRHQYPRQQPPPQPQQPRQSRGKSARGTRVPARRRERGEGPKGRRRHGRRHRDRRRRG